MTLHVASPIVQLPFVESFKSTLPRRQEKLAGRALSATVVAMLSVLAACTAPGAARPNSSGLTGQQASVPPSGGPAATTMGVPAWKEDVVYQVFPRTFRDGNGDGVGDLSGVVEKVPYLHALGVNIVWLNPIYPSGGVDSGYDVSDFLSIDPAYGSMADFTRLQRALHDRGMKLMMDLVLNHTSDQHPWFIAEVARKSLQHQFSALLSSADADEADTLLGLLADLDSALEAQGPHVAAAKKLIDAYLLRDDRAAEAAGYPSHHASLHSLAAHLRACVGQAGACRRAAMPFDDFYLWLDQPNNWHSLFGGSAWREEASTGAVCMHFFSPQQIDLNWRNPQVRDAMGMMAKTWQQRGVDGFRLDSIISIAKDPRFLSDNAPSDCVGISFFTNLPQIHRYIRHFTEALGPQALTIGEASFSRQEAALKFARIDSPEVREVFVFDHVTLDGVNGTKWRQIPLDVLKFKQTLVEQQQLIHNKAWLGNYLENHDQLRTVSRFGDAKNYPIDSAQALATLLMTLEGTPFIYQGQELGMTDLPAGTIKRPEDLEDVEARGWYHDRIAEGKDAAQTLDVAARRCRDNVRSAMQWSAGPRAGFSDGATKVRINPNAASINADAQVKDAHSTWSAYRQLIDLRHQRPEWVVGDFTDLAPQHPKVFAYRRELKGVASWVLINLSSQAQSVSLPAASLPATSPQVVWHNAPRVPPPPLSATVALAPWQAVVYGGTIGSQP